MDPNANLVEQRDLVRILENRFAVIDNSVYELEVDRLVELVAAMDQWLSHDGFLPDAWERSEHYEKD